MIIFADDDFVDAVADAWADFIREVYQTLESCEDNGFVAVERGLEFGYPREIQIILEYSARGTEGQEALQSLWSSIMSDLNGLGICDECFEGHEPEFWRKPIKSSAGLLMVANQPTF